MHSVYNFMRRLVKEIFNSSIFIQSIQCGIGNFVTSTGLYQCYIENAIIFKVQSNSIFLLKLVTI
jgi:hypothetical protein